MQKIRYKDSVCKGSFSLGSNCGHCEKCVAAGETVVRKRAILKYTLGFVFNTGCTKVLLIRKTI